ncbi:hypothetical protein DNK57_02045 [Methanothermobacter thermautotrophicus]|uniref:DUF5518 domain-containing protein n=2 Tax=Methanothermobacter thermautotrophicus TaxID=145262 RepID=A0A842YJE6_METTF|nr:hypothetical protein [Methanothermobacter thermautotrophicus]MCQ8904859.1 DUF5518 domain-containing protein [Methanothermobacter sp.]
MVKWGAVILGFVLSIVFPYILSPFVGQASILGLFLAGFVVGLMVKEGATGGFWNATVAGAFGGIVIAILLTIFGTAIAGPVGFLIGAFAGGILVLALLIVSMLFMGIGGAIGGFIAGD